MPLPDERPRQSVANLIGRFEQQKNRTSIGNNSSATPPIAIPRKPIGVQERKASVGPEIVAGLLKARGAPEPRSSSDPISVIPQDVSGPPPPYETDTIPPLDDVPLELSPVPVKSEVVEVVVPSEPETPVKIAPRPPSVAVARASSVARKSTASPKSTLPAGTPPTRAARASAVPATTRAAINSQHAGIPSTPLRPQVTGTSTLSTTIHAPHYATPIRAQNTGFKAPSSANSKTSPSTSTSRTKTPIPQPRASVSGTRSALTAPTASSLAKARQPVAAIAAPKSSSASSTVKKTSTLASSTSDGRKTPAKTPPPPAATSAVPFPSVRKSKSKATATTTTAPSARRPRISLPGGGPSAAALAARAAVAAPPVPAVPTDDVPAINSPAPAAVASPATTTPADIAASADVVPEIFVPATVDEMTGGNDLDEAVAMLELGTPQASLEEGPISEIDAVRNEAEGESMTNTALSASPPENLTNKKQPNPEAGEDQGSANIEIEPPTPTDNNEGAAGGDASPDPVPIAPEHNGVGVESKAESIGDIPDAD